MAMPFCLELYADGSATTIFIRSRGVGVDITLKLEQQKSSSKSSAGGRFTQCVQQQKQSRAVAISAAEQLRPAQLRPEGANKCRTVETRTVETSTVETSEGGGGRFS